MLNVSENFIQRVPYLLGIVIILYITKPNIIFKPNGKPRIYGIGHDEEGYRKTLYTFQFVIIIIALIVYNYF